ncbi:MAG: uroporphyrinogen-III C-methyltransferase [Thermodesulfobacteriota bacterium]|jgi:uroporphyrinogen III methyltransferase/synthase|nr:MAG: uroporphyrinogen-III C-methyltransferase [Thermodesulfobacteriota bacterium]
MTKLRRKDKSSQINLPPRAQKKKGKVFLVGAGPGDIGLVTLRAKECIARADVIVHDSLVNPIIFGWAREDAEIVNMGKKGWGVHVPQETITTALIEHALQGKTVVRLKGGDPFIFGRGGEEAQKLAEQGIPFDVVPGVTSAVGVSAYSGIPLTHRDFASQVTFFTGHPDSRIKWENIPSDAGTLVIYMGLANLPYISEKLIQGRWSPDTPVALISRGSLGDQEVLTAPLKRIAKEAKKRKIITPVLAVIGKVVTLREKIKWFENKPLFGLRILVTGSKQQAFELAKNLEELGAVPIMLPTIRVTYPDSWEDLDSALDHLHDYHCIIFPSINSVKCFFHRFAERDKDIRELSNIVLGAIGENTINEFVKRMLKVDLPSPHAGMKDFFAMIKAKGLKGKKILIPGCKESRGELAEFFQEMGNKVVTVDAYKITDEKINAQELRKALVSPGIDLIIFTSPASVRNFRALTQGRLWEKILSTLKVATVGPLTAKEAVLSGLSPAIIPKRFTIASLIAEIAKKLGQEKVCLMESELLLDQANFI